MLQLNVLSLLKSRGITKYALFNKLNNIRAIKGEKLLNYTNFQNMIGQKNKSILYTDLDELCDALNCEISDLLTKIPDVPNKK